MEEPVIQKTHKEVHSKENKREWDLLWRSQKQGRKNEALKSPKDETEEISEKWTSNQKKKKEHLWHARHKIHK